jgi:hypothetical protein
MKRLSVILIFIFLLLPSTLFAQRSTGGRSRTRSYQLTVTCNVPNAQVSVESLTDKDVQNGNASYELTLSAGDYAIRVSAPGYITQSRTINLSANATEDFQLQLATGTVKFLFPNSLRAPNSNLNSITIKVDGERINGNHNASIELRPGRHIVEVLAGGLRMTTAVDVSAGQTYEITPVIELEIR